MKKQENAIKEIIKRYGDVIDLRKSPYLIAEIIRNYADVFGTKGSGRGKDPAPEPGTPPIPSGLPELSPEELYAEIAKISTSLRQLHRKVEKLTKSLG